MQQDIALPLSVFMVLSALIWLFGRMLLARAASGEVEEGRSRPAFGILNNVLAALLPTSDAAKRIIDRELRQAGFYAPHARADYFATRNVALFAWVVLVAFTAFAVYDPQQELTLLILVIGIVFGILIFATPRLVLQSRARHRVTNIQAALPDGLDMLNMCMTGGLSLQMAFERVGVEIRSSHRDLATEFDIIRRHSEAHTMERALDLFAERIDTPDVRSLAAITSQSVRLGSNVGAAMQEYADGMRTNQRQRAEERGNRRSVAMLFPVALCLAPPVYILLLGPAVLELRDFALRENRSGGVLAVDIEALQQGVMSPRLSQTPEPPVAAPSP
jgi:tight adherence protein C